MTYITRFVSRCARESKSDYKKRAKEVARVIRQEYPAAEERIVKGNGVAYYVGDVRVAYISYV
jgi:hypothetical protein